MTIAARLSASSALIIIALARSAAGAYAQDPLPDAQQILARYHEAIGAADFANVSSIHSTGEIAIPAAGVRGSLEIWQSRPNRTTMHAAVPGFGEVRTGFTGEHGWAVEPVTGARILTGAEGVQARDDGHFESHLRSAELVESMTTIERTTLSGYDCYKVRVIWKSGRETLDCYSVDSGLLVGTLLQHQTAAGPAEATILYEEYREFAGVRIPTRITTIVSGVQQVMNLFNVELNAVHDSIFTPPPEVRALTGG